MTKPTNPAIPLRTKRKPAAVAAGSPAAIDVPKAAVKARRKAAAATVVPPAPVETRYPVKKVATANICGFLGAIQQAKSILTNSRGFGEAIDHLNRLEAKARSEATTAIHAELKARRVKPEGLNIGTSMSDASGLEIITSKMQ